MSKTENDLKEAFAGESQANRKYLAFAKKADDEGYKQVAKLFRAAAEAETIHAHNHLRELKGIRSTKENLEEAISGESHEFQHMYPAMIEDAKAEGNNGALRSFHIANEVEKMHAALYKKALDNIGKNKETDYYICKVCGATIEHEAPDVCPVCGAKKMAFYKVEDRRRQAEGRRQKTEDRRQKTEDRRQKTEDRRQKTEDRRQKTEGKKAEG